MRFCPSLLFSWAACLKALIEQDTHGAIPLDNCGINVIEVTEAALPRHRHHVLLLQFDKHHSA
jgi:hypothetical protein